MTQDPSAAAMALLDQFMAAFNARDVEAFEATFNFPSIRLASGRLVTLNKGDMTAERFVFADPRDPRLGARRQHHRPRL